MPKVVVKLPKEHDAQKEMSRLHEEHRFLAVRAGRRMGKTLWAAKRAVKAMLSGKRVCWVAPSHNLLATGFFMLAGMIPPELIELRNSNDKLYTLITGGLIKGWVSSDPNCGRGWEFDLIIIDEAAFTQNGKETEEGAMCAVWERALKPTLLKTLGKVIVVSNTCGVNDDNFFYHITHGGYGFVECHFPSRANPHLLPEELERLRETTEPRTFKQEYEAEWVDWRGASLISLDALTPPEDPPYPPAFVFATLDTAIKVGPHNDGTAVVYAAYDDIKQRLYILDWDIQQIEAATMTEWMPSCLEKLAGFARSTKARGGSTGLFIEDAAGGAVMLQHARTYGMPAYPISNRVKGLGKDARVTAVIDYLYRRQIVLTPAALEKQTKFKDATRNHLVKQVCGYVMGVKEQEDDLLDAFVYAVLLAFVPSSIESRG